MSAPAAGTVSAKARVGDVFRLVMAGPAVSDAAVRLWLLYRAHHIDGRGAYLADDQAAKRLGCSTRKVQRVRGELVHMKALVVVKHGPNPPSYYPLPLADDSPRMATQDLPPVASQAGKDSPHDSPPVTPIHNEIPVLNRSTLPPPPPSEESPVGDAGGSAQPPAASPKPSKKPNRGNWLEPFADAWRDRFGAAPDHGYLAGTFSPLVDKHGTDEVLERWRYYLAGCSEVRFASPRKFAGTYDSWSPAVDPAVLRALWERDRATVPA